MAYTWIQNLHGIPLRNGHTKDEERKACKGLDPDQTFIRLPPTPHELDSFITDDDKLFQTIHMGAAIVDLDLYSLVIDGMVERPLSLTLEQLKMLPCTTITAFHECYGSPLKAPTENLWRIGNVKWTGVRLSGLLEYASPLPTARYVWSEGLDFGKFGGIAADRYQKDLPIEKAASPEVLLAYEMNGKPLSRNRGGPVRLIVPGWFGTNSTKWLSRLTLESSRAGGHFTTTFYNEKDPTNPNGGLRPVWKVEPNSMITRPIPNAKLSAPEIVVKGWAWAEDGIISVHVSYDGQNWFDADLEKKTDFSWQRFRRAFHLQPGSYEIIARAMSKSGLQQPVSGHRNHVHKLKILIE